MAPPSRHCLCRDPSLATRGVPEPVAVLVHYHRHAEGQSDEFQQSQAELRQQWERAFTEGAQLRNVREGTRTANARSASEVVRPRAREAQLSTKVSTMQSQETTDLQGQLQNLHPETARINDLINQIQTSRDSMNNYESRIVHRKSRRRKSSKCEGSKFLEQGKHSAIGRD